MVYTGDKKREYDRNWKRRNRATQKKYEQELRVRAITKLGGKCITCGCDDLQALEFNHINGGGYTEHFKHGGCQKQLYLDILFDRRIDIDLRCRVCNSLHYLVELKGLKNRWKIIWT
jgi:hypothetical protein